MARSVRIPIRLRITLFAVISLSWSSGVLFFIMDHWIRIEGEFGPEKHPLQFGILKGHGAAAFLMMIAFGFLLASHVSVSWPVRRMRPSGLVLVAAMGFLISSAYGLYYIGNETLRTYVSYAHAGVGVCFPVLLTVHLIQGRRIRKGRKAGKRASKPRFPRGINGISPSGAVELER